MSRVQVLIFGVLVLCVACGRGGADSEQSRAGSEDWETLARGESPCGAANVKPDARWAAVMLQDPPGAFRVPSGFEERAGGAPRSRWWVGTDSTELTLWVSEEYAMAGAGSDRGLIARLERPSYRLEGICRLVVGGRLGMVTQFRHVDARGADTVFGIVAQVFVRPGLVLGAMGLTPSRAMRDSLFGAVSELRFTRPSP